MNIVTEVIQFAGETLTLTNQRVIYWQAQKTLILSDLHLGKSAHFRKHGIAIPHNMGMHDMTRLQHLIGYFGAEKVLVVGDLIHAGSNKDVLQIKNFINNISDVQFVLIKGNHDRISLQQLNDLGIYDVHQNLKINNIHFLHHIHSEEESWFISGHTHPGVRIKMPSHGYMKLPCFVLKKNHIILPAFSHFTGLNTSLVGDNVKYFAIAEEGIFQL